MRSVTYSMGVSLDGYIAGPAGDFDWTAPDEEVFRFVTDQIRQVGVHLLGRRLYETMLYWETADQDPSLDDSMREWAALWKPLPKVVFSATLPAVRGNARLASGGVAEEIERLRAGPTEAWARCSTSRRCRPTGAGWRRSTPTSTRPSHGRIPAGPRNWRPNAMRCWTRCAQRPVLAAARACPARHTSERALPSGRR